MTQNTKKLNNVHWTYESLDRLTYVFANYTKGKQTVRECQNIITYDIETSNGWTNGVDVIGWDHELAKVLDENGDNVYDLRTAVSVMYVWQCAIETPMSIEVYMGRTWDEYREFEDRLSRVILMAAGGIVGDPYDAHIMKLAKKKTKNVEYHVYIHNLTFEFQHLRNIHENELSKYKQSVFARSMRKPMKARIRLNGVNITYNDTLCLTCTSLYNWTKDLAVSKLKEVVDDNYYNIIRTPYTKLTEDEINYSINDVVSMVYGMMEYRKKYTSLHNIPMTQTGEVRRVCFSEIAQSNRDWAAKCLAINTSTSFEFYLLLRKAFLGGWTHANCRYANTVQRNLKCFDFTSSYPAVMCTRTFPVGEFVECDVAELDWLDTQPLNDIQYHYLVDVTFREVKSKTWNTFWSESKTDEIEGEEIDNGKIVGCKMMRTTMTDLDFRRFREVYTSESVEVNKLWKAEADYLPKEFIGVILKYYNDKTKLKKNKDRAEDYNIAKQFVNGIYGDAVKKIIDDVITYKYGWNKTAATVDDYNNTLDHMTIDNTYTTYQIGVWVTAWARHNLWDAIIHLDDKVVYCDTDSVKGLFDDDDLQWFFDYNKSIDGYVAKVAAKYNMDAKLWTPVATWADENGVSHELECPLGYFDREDDYVEFKTLGAKRYAASVIEDGELVTHTTIAGLSKEAGQKVIKTVGELRMDMEVSTEDSKKLITKYNDNQGCHEWTDRDGVKYVCIDKYGLCLEPTTFSLTADDYKIFLSLLAGGELNDYFDTPEILR